LSIQAPLANFKITARLLKKTIRARARKTSVELPLEKLHRALGGAPALDGGYGYGGGFDAGYPWKCSM
jgi:hypothetical protein